MLQIFFRHAAENDPDLSLLCIIENDADIPNKGKTFFMIKRWEDRPLLSNSDICAGLFFGMYCQRLNDLEWLKAGESVEP